MPCQFNRCSPEQRKGQGPKRLNASGLFETQEQWLQAAVVFFGPIFERLARRFRGNPAYQVRSRNCLNERSKPYSVRMSREWIDALGAPVCPGCDEQMQVAGADRGEGE